MLDHRDSRPGLVSRARLPRSSPPTASLPGTDRTATARFLASITKWLASARSAGLGPDDIEAIYRTPFRNCFAEGAA